MTDGDIRCTDTELELLRPLSDLPMATRTAVADWLLIHGIEPNALVVGTVVERDHFAGALQWKERQSDGSNARRWRYTGEDAWPAPFPTVLLRCS